MGVLCGAVDYWFLPGTLIYNQLRAAEDLGHECMGSCLPCADFIKDRPQCINVCQKLPCECLLRLHGLVGAFGPLKRIAVRAEAKRTQMQGTHVSKSSFHHKIFSQKNSVNVHFEFCNHW